MERGHIPPPAMAGGMALALRMAAHQDSHATPVHLGRPTAGTMPRLRDQIAAACKRPYTAEYLNGFIDQIRKSDPRGSGTLTRVDMTAADVIRWLHTADLYYVSDAMTAVCAQAARSMPPYLLTPDHVPSRVGLMVWAAPPAAMHALSPEDNPSASPAQFALRAVLWAPCETHAGPGVLATLWADTASLLRSARYRDAEERQPGLLATIHANLGPLACFDAVPLPYGVGRDGGGAVRVAYRPVAAVLSTWLIMGQRIAATTTQRPDRPVRLEYRAARRPEPTVRHITLRRAVTAPDPETAGGTGHREYHHRWVVTGFWRDIDRRRVDVPEEQHRLVWVTEHLRGPEGAPIIGGERVHILRR